MRVAETIEPTHRSAKVQKRASNVLKLSLESKKLEEELRIMNERLKAAEQAVSSKRGSTPFSPPSV
jgi:outer membrane murein-binding lipoprotein Lpp